MILAPVRVDQALDSRVLTAQTELNQVESEIRAQHCGTLQIALKKFRNSSENVD